MHAVAGHAGVLSQRMGLTAYRGVVPVAVSPVDGQTSPTPCNVRARHMTAAPLTMDNESLGNDGGCVPRLRVLIVWDEPHPTDKGSLTGGGDTGTWSGQHSYDRSRPGASTTKSTQKKFQMSYTDLKVVQRRL